MQDSKFNSNLIFLPILFLLLGTASSDGDCGEFSTSHSYKRGQSGYLSLPFPVRTKVWRLEVFLDRNVTSLDIFEAKMILPRGGGVSREFVFVNEYWNGEQKPGESLSLGYQAKFDGVVKPNFTTIILNKRILCSPLDSWEG